MKLDKEIKNKKQEILDYFRNRSSEFLSEVKNKFADTQFDKRAKAMNEKLNQTKNNVVVALLQKSEKEQWSNQEKLEAILMINYCHIVVMIESRNSVRAYEYMDFSRRMGEFWDLFCRLCFYYPINDISLFVPPLFSEVKKKLANEITDYIDRLAISNEEMQALKFYYDKVWGLVTSGEIQLELDLHFIFNHQKYVLDFKSGFGSNEKGNTNRLLLVATIYQNLNENYKCLLLVRTDENNSYFNTLKNSQIWEVYCGHQTYQKINDYSGFNLKQWIETHIDWKSDFNAETLEHLTENNLLQYLSW